MLDQLYYFSEVYRNRSISRAADFLHISRQALSHSVKGLEQELGVELFVREKDGVVPTKAADSLYESAQVILREEAQIRENMLSFTHKSADIRQYTIAAPMFYVNSYGETLITQLAQRFPTDMFILKTIKNSDDSITRQTDINIQLKLSKQNKKSMKVPQDYQCEELLRLAAYIWVQRDHPLTQAARIDYRTLRAYPLSVLKNTHNGEEFAQMLSLGYNPIVEVPSNLKGNIRRFGHYTIDFKYCKAGFFLDDLLGNDPDFKRLAIDEKMYIYVIYRKNISPEIVSFIVESLKTSLLN